MNILSLLSIFTFMINVYLGLHVFFLDRKSKVNRLFLVLSLIQAIWTFIAIFVYSAESRDMVLSIVKISYFIIVPYFALVLHFCLTITKIGSLKAWHYMLLYLPVVILIYSVPSSNLLYKDAVKVNDYWTYVISADSLWSYFYIAYYNLYLIASLYILFIWNRTSKTIKDKRQSLLIFTALLIAFAASIIEGIIIPSVTSYRTLALSPLYSTIWMFGIWFVIVRYRFLSITPALVSKVIIANIDESIILADNESRVLTVNNAVLELFNYSEEQITSRRLCDLIEEYGRVQKEIEDLSSNEHMSFSTRIHFIKNDNSRILMDAKFKTVCDRFGDPLGTLVIGREVREIRQFKSIYKITNRQAEIIRHILQGKSNKEIAKLVGVSERTIKGHITSIYHKLCVRNKMELFNLLKEFNLIPEQHADKSVLAL